MQPLINPQTSLQSDSSAPAGAFTDPHFYGAGSFGASGNGGTAGETWFPWLCKRSDIAAKFGFAASMGYLALTIAYGIMLNGSAETASQTAVRVADTLARQAGLEISQIVIRGRAHLTEAGILAALGKTSGQSIFAFNVQSAQARLYEIGWIKRAEIHRLWPSTLTVEIEEHAAAAVWIKAGDNIAVNEGGQVLGPVKPGDLSKLLRISGDDAPADVKTMLAALAAHPDLSGSIEVAERIGGRRWDILMKDGIRVRLPAGTPGEALATLRELLFEGRLPAHEIEALDLRQPGQAVVVVKDPQQTTRETILKALTSASQAGQR